MGKKAAERVKLRKWSMRGKRFPCEDGTERRD